MEHYCSIYGNSREEENLNRYKDRYWKELESRQFGSAISTCYADGNKLFVENGEYESQVNFCPFCGAAAVEQAPKESEFAS